MELKKYVVTIVETTTRMVNVLADDPDKIDSVVATLWLNGHLKTVPGARFDQDVKVVRIEAYAGYVQGDFERKP